MLRDVHRVTVMATLLAFLASLPGCTGSSTTRLDGAGATFPAVIYARWFDEFNGEHPEIRVEYTGVGSGAGVRRFIDEQVDFGASDAAMTPEEIEQVDRGALVLPLTAGAIVLGYRLDEGPDDLKLTRDAYTGIFLGKVTKWNDPAIQEANPDATLPDKQIKVVYRTESSGTTYVFTKHLDAVSDDWSQVSKTVEWPVGSGAKGNDGITALVQQTDGAIGYVEYGYARDTLSMASLENAAGNFVSPSLEAFQATLSSTELPDDMIAWMPDPAGDQAYPIVTYTWLLCYERYPDAATAAAMKMLLEYCLTEGQKVSADLGYIPLPEGVVERVRAKAETIQP